MDFTILIPSCNEIMARKTQECLRPYNSIIFDGRGYDSFAKLINDCIKSCPTEIIIIANDKVRGDSSYIDGILSKLDEGYGLASFYRFGFFGFSKQLIREIGYFDENFKQGGYEDVDFKNRLIEADIGIFETTTCPYEESGSRWKSNNNKTYYDSKWSEKYLSAGILTRLKEENITPSFLKWPKRWYQSVLPKNNEHLRYIEVVNGIY